MIVNHTGQPKASAERVVKDIRLTTFTLAALLPIVGPFWLLFPTRNFKEQAH